MKNTILLLTLLILGSCASHHRDAESCEKKDGQCQKKTERVVPETNASRLR